VLAQRAASEGPRWTRAVEDQSAPIPEERVRELGGKRNASDWQSLPNGAAIAIKNAQLFTEVEQLKNRLQVESLYLREEVKIEHNKILEDFRNVTEDPVAKPVGQNTCRL
jgi:hypothetical protein